MSCLSFFCPVFLRSYFIFSYELKKTLHGTWMLYYVTALVFKIELSQVTPTLKSHANISSPFPSFCFPS